jgi:hypothetical protein
MKISGWVVDQDDRDVSFIIKIAMNRGNPCQLVGVEQILGIGAPPRIQPDKASLSDRLARDQHLADIWIMIIEGREGVIRVAP